MLSKLKQFKDIRDQAKQLQSALSEESVTVNKNGLVLTMNGNLDLTGLAIDENLLTPTKKDKLESLIKELHKDALKKMQRTMAMKMKEMGGLPGIPGLS
ncbi:MAG: hypothetical protein GW939_03145 [Candidatus Magasanikbacteria bacterium]|uniref:Nucleoid-associated protein, YbaB/EbfC family n=1 Tax=Candidatus Magasanikbacteria bacterium CG10_big_fil_rev_8_21_14_0_10_38_6 TaxID=1974647 RepID=A0A2M6P212_9BACT|nr:hypothetical protein [Candidatus Magasanikbacteria bacterium]NCS72147.1 hypothetical protein [Candidatus Magasanikbacteria bacterium]PIR77765.1 MAG: hypothetical protein COU30_00680 [Candidatus Magasanikbacteria bacterium CG10_big_fil_rev_8_21_14_0_10_38_6]